MRSILALVFCGLLLTGCGGGAEMDRVQTLASKSPSVAEVVDDSASITPAKVSSPQAGVEPRKIIYTAELTLQVNDVRKSKERLLELVKENEGYVQDGQLRSNDYSLPSGTWTIRIPVSQYEGFLEKVEDLGKPIVRQQRAEDVTARYVDLEARISSKKKLETRVLDLLDRHDEKLAGVLQLEEQLARIRTEIEQMEGQFRSLQRQVKLTTVTVNLQQESPQPVARSFTARIHAAWTGSLTKLREAGENLAIALTAVAPWAVVILVFSMVVAFVIFLIRRTLRRALQTT